MNYICNNCYKRGIVMKIKKIKLKEFKRFTDLTIEGFSEKAKLIVLVGPNGCGKTSFMEALCSLKNMYGYRNWGTYDYLSKTNSELEKKNWYQILQQKINIEFYDYDFEMLKNDIYIREHFYLRNAYRNDSNFAVSRIENVKDPIHEDIIYNFYSNDSRVQKNYMRLVGTTIKKVFDNNYDNIIIKKAREEIIGKIQNSLDNIFGDLKLSSIGDPLDNGCFFFSKGSSEDFNYINLSSGEKSVFDLLLDLVLVEDYYKNAVYCIDEPEAHIHTQLQGKVLKELYNLIGDNSQLIISTHSIGMIKEAINIKKDNPELVDFLDFTDLDFDEEQVMKPTNVDKTILNKFYELALGEFSELVLPEIVVICEGNSKGNKRKNFDKNIYEKIFNDHHPEALFISGGSCEDIIDIENKQGDLINVLSKKTKIIKVIDRDNRSENETKELEGKGIQVLKRRNIEEYLLDDEIIKKLCNKNKKNDIIDVCISKKKEIISKNENDYKKASGDLYLFLKKELELKYCGNNVVSFLRDTMAPLITDDTSVYKEMEKIIFKK